MPASPPSIGSSTNNTPPIKVSVEPTRKKDSVMPADGKQAPLPSVDLPSLEKQLRETDAIGLFTKITLKNQIDDMVNQFREYHGKRREISLAELRQRYDMLLLKLLLLLQDKDPPLAHTIVASRDTIWSMLTDPTMTFVVPLAAAIVERRGGMLIHGSIIAREYGIPCVTGVPDATSRIRTGDTITVDGYLVIVIIERDDA